jgi:iron complex outermembrane receptor protein
VRITRGDADTTGNRFSGIPEDSAAIFAKYNFQPGSALAGFGIGAGVRYIGVSYGDDQNTFRNKPVGLMDAVLDYDLAQADQRWKGARLQVNATNLLDTRFQSCRTGYCGLGEPQRIIGSLIYRF